jgi:hypothetical protein
MTDLVRLTKPVVIVVGADKGGVGKTTVSRTLLDYFEANKVPTRAFDTETPRGVLKRFYPGSTEIVDLTIAQGQMKVFDTLRGEFPAVTLIDARAGLLSRTLEDLSNIGFIESAERGEITFAVVHIIGSSIASLEEIAQTSAYVKGCKYFLVKNYINDTTFFEWDETTKNSYLAKISNAAELTVPRLTEQAIENVDVESIPFLRFIANRNANNAPANYSFVLRGYVRHWLIKVWKEFDRVKLCETVGIAQQETRIPAHQ